MRFGLSVPLVSLLLASTTAGADDDSRFSRTPQPHYPDAALRMPWSGALCHAELTVEPDGAVSEVRLLSCHPIFQREAARTLLRWRARSDSGAQRRHLPVDLAFHRPLTGPARPAPVAVAKRENSSGTSAATPSAAAASAPGASPSTASAAAESTPRPPIVWVDQDRPAWPDAARAANLGDATCRARVRVETNGRVSSVEVDGCDEVFVQALRPTLMGWRAKPLDSDEPLTYAVALQFKRPR